MDKIWYNVGVTIGRMAIYGCAVMLLFNWLSPIFNLTNELTYFQSCGLTVLCWILFKKED